MKALIIGASGAIGSAAVRELEKDTQLLYAGRSAENYPVDLSNRDTIKALFEKTGPLDAIICAASRGMVFKPVSDMTIEEYQSSIEQKVMGQIDVALQGIAVLKDGGSITLTTGCLNRDVVAGGSAAALANNAVEGFVKVAALELPRGIRINVVSPNVLDVSAVRYEKAMPGFEPVSSDKVGRAFRKSIYGIQTGQVYCVA